MSPAKRTLLVGWDAACWEYLDPLLQAGELPALESLIRRGARGTLRSTLPAWTPTAWASITTGKNPGKHGIFGMVHRQPGTYDFVPTMALMRRGSSFWQRLNEAGLRVGLVNVPFIYPIEPLNGFAVAGFGTPNMVAGFAYPTTAERWIADHVAGFQPALSQSLYNTMPVAELYQAEREHQAQQIKVAYELAQQNEVDVLVINLMLGDHANHYMPQMTQVEQAWRDTDQDLARLLQAFQPDNVMLISDHGSARLKGLFVTPLWLEDEGYLVRRINNEAERDAALNWALARWFRACFGWSGLPEKGARKILKRLVPLLPPALADRFWEGVERDVPLARVQITRSRRADYASTRIFPHSPFSGLWYVNQRGRDPQGTVAPLDKEGLLDELSEKLMALSDPETGQPLITGAYRPETLYEGPAVAEAPDLILDTHDSPWWVLETLPDDTTIATPHRYFIENTRNFGLHRRDGLFVFAGSDFEQAGIPHHATVMDIPATLLYLYDIPIPDDYDGIPMVETTSLAARQPVRQQPGDPAFIHSSSLSYTDEENAELTDRLRALGYLI